MVYPSTISPIFSINPEMTSTLVSLGQKAAQHLKHYRFVRIVSHNDADGLTAAGIMSIALLRSNIVFQTSIVRSLNQDVIDNINQQDYGNDGTVLFCDMGSGQPELVNQINDEVIIIDHHQIVGDHNDHVHINPHLVSIDGASLLSASGMAYYAACSMGNNSDLAGLALTGAIGDKQKMDGPNGEILREAKDAGVVSVRRGLKVPDGPAEDVLLTLVEPYLDSAGDREATRTFLTSLGVGGPIQDMKTEDLTKLISAMALKIAGQAEPSIVQSMVGDVLILNNEVVHNVYNMEWMLQCCGKMDQAALGLSLCFRDANVVDEAARLASKYQHTLVEHIRAAQALIKEKNHIRYVALEDASGTGIIAGTLIRYVCPDKPFITLNKTENIIKVSARGTRQLVERGLDLAVALREAAAVVGGQGGGHNIASGASIPYTAAEKFLTAVDTIVGGQLT